MAVKKLVVAFRNALIKVTVFWVLLVATYLALGRQFFPQIEHIQPQLEQWLSSQLMQPVRIGKLTGQWDRFDPVIIIEELQIGSELSVSSMTLVPGMLESIAHAGLAFTRFEVRDFQGRLWQENGRWQLAGLRNQETNTSSTFTAAALLNLLQRQKSVQLSDIYLTIEPEQYPAFDLHLQSGELANYNTENSLAADAQVNYLGVNMPISLQVEFYQQRPQDNRVYFSHGEFDFSPWLNNRFPLLTKLTAEGEYWIDFTGTQWRNIAARQSFDRLTLTGVGQPMDIERVTAEWFANTEEPLAVKVELSSYEINGNRYPASKAFLTSSETGLDVRFDRAPAQAISAWLAVNDGSGLWAGLSPDGQVSDVVVSLHEDQPVTLSAKLTDVSIDEYQGVPALKNLNADVQIEGSRGRIRLQPTETEIGLSYLYDEALNAQIAIGEFNWQMTTLGGVQLSAEVDVNLVSDKNEPNLPVRVRWFQRGTSEAEKQLGVENFMGVNVTTLASIEREWLLSFMTARPIPQYITDLMSQQLLSVDLAQTSLSYVNAGQQDWLQIGAQFERLNYEFLENWPRVLDASGMLQLTGAGLRVDINQAYYDGLQLTDSVLAIDFTESELSLQVTEQFSPQETLSLLTRPPIRDWTGAQLDTWAMPTGQSNIKLQLSLPLNAEPNVQLNVVADVRNADLLINNFNLALQDIDATVRFDTQVGLSILGASFLHDALPQLGSVTIPMSGEVIDVRLVGQSQPAFWGTYFDDPALKLVTGVVDHDTQIAITDFDTTIHVASNLTGVALELPKPLTKASEDAWPLDLTVVLHNSGNKTINMVLNQSLNGAIELNDNNFLQAGWFGYGDVEPRALTDGLYVDVATDTLNGDDWWQLVQSARALYGGAAEKLDGIDSFALRPTLNSNALLEQVKQINLQSDELLYLGLPWQQTDVTIARLESEWDISFTAEQANGSAVIADASDVIEIALEKLVVDTAKETEDSIELGQPETVDPLAGFSPKDLPNVNLSVKQLTLNQQDLGEWQLQVRVEGEALRVTELNGLLPSANVQGELLWQKIPDSDQTETVFTGRVDIANVLDLLTEWGYPPVLTSRDGRFDIDFSWRGSPAVFDIKQVRGAVQLEVNQGSVLQVEAYEGVKLIGLLNFSRLFQRLALDFSDLMGAGLSFDKMSGEFLFDRGFARVGEPLIIDGSATKFRFNGDADLYADNIDVDMLLTIPLSSTFPLVALLAGVSPQAAAAIFVTERVFNNQLERLSTVRMSITGSFANPEMRFYRLDESMAN